MKYLKQKAKVLSNRSEGVTIAGGWTGSDSHIATSGCSHGRGVASALAQVTPVKVTNVGGKTRICSQLQDTFSWLGCDIVAVKEVLLDGWLI
ncbi:hypothetical protein VTL71DRAFT_8347 [Oculimacula yallundae]|uniref:Uncharacterized protein n=1 Tax=Oculimacula yallundae TaxID=86028 RepID=A0ABR4CZR4_9HELO